MTRIQINVQQLKTSMALCGPQQGFFRLPDLFPILLDALLSLAAPQAWGLLMAQPSRVWALPPWE